MKRDSGFLKKILFFGAWILCTTISVALAYWLMGAIPKVEDELGYFTRLLHVFQNPFADYFNNYTPIGMILAFIVTELLFGIIFISKMIVNPNPISAEDEHIDKWHTLKPMTTEEPKVEFVDQQDTTVSEPKEKEKKRKNAAEKNEKDDDVNEVFLKEDMFLKLFNSGYTMSQINAMMELTTYIPDVDVQQMTKMFNPSMGEDEIRSYIEIFFG